MYVILISKVGAYRTELGDGLKPLEEYDYLFCGKRKAHYVIAELTREVKVTLTEVGEGGAVNHLPSKFLPRFDTLEAARARQARGPGSGLRRWHWLRPPRVALGPGIFLTRCVLLRGTPARQPHALH